MTIDPELLKQLINSFKTELNEHTVAITNGLLALENNSLDQKEQSKIIEIIFRSAHNIKGTSRSLGINNVSEIAHRIESLFASIQTKEKVINSEIIDLCLESVDKMHSALDCFIEKKPLSFDLNDFIKKLEINKTTNSVEKKSIAPKNKTKIQENHESDSIRVPIHKIDKISSLLENIQVNKISIVDHYDELTKLVSSIKSFNYLWKQLSNAINNNDSFEHIQSLQPSINDSLMEIDKVIHRMQKNMRIRINDLSQISHALQEEVSLLRMVPVGNLLCTFPRYVRDLSNELNKKVELIIKSDEVKVDKVVLDGLKDPLIHLLRNAIDHGIETPETRNKIGKSETGSIIIDIKEEEGQIKISLTDDGAGIDSKKVQEIAEIKKLISTQELAAMSETEKLELIFHSGLSTKEIITDISGRGVGLDVVKSNIEELKGHITLATEPGKSTTFTLSVPVSISSEIGLLVSCSGIYFAIPTGAIEHVLMIEVNNIIHIQGSQAILLENKTIPLRSLANLLHLEKNNMLAEKKLPLVVIKKGSQSVALLVDEIIGEREIIIKPLQSPITKLPFIAGGTLSESNQIIIVLETSDLIKEALQQNKIKALDLHTAENKQPAKPHILVVDDSITTRTLEKNVLESKNYQVTVAVNGKEAWDILQKQKFALLITDVTMPLMDGFSLTDKVKKSEHLRDMPVIIVTSLGSESEKKRGIDVGADAYIVKSEFESGALLDVVSQLV